VTLALFGAVLAILSSGSMPSATSPDPAPPLGALAVDEDRNEFRTLDRATDTTAVVLTPNSLELIDLDTAQQHTVLLDEEVNQSTIDIGGRLLRTSEALLVATGPSVFSFDLATGDTSELRPGDRLAPARTPGHAWIWSEVAGSWAEIDGDGEIVRQFEPPTASRAWDHGVGTPELITTPDLGVYALQQDGSWQPVATQLAIAGNNDIALTQECGSLNSCEYRLVDVTSGTSLDQPWLTSLEPQPSTQLRLSPSGKSLLEMQPTNRSWESVYVYSGVTVRPTSCTQGWRHATWSIDETLLACVTERGVAVTDVKNGPVALFDQWDDPPLAVVLAPTQSLRSLGN
jgi:hypothetical protein